MSIDINELNKIVTEILNKYEEDLNKNSFPILETLGNVMVPTLYSLGKNQICPKDVAFNLDTIENAEILNEIYKEDPRIQILIRRSFSYSTAITIMRKPENAESILKPLIYEMCLSLKKTIGFSPEKLNCGIYGTFKRPFNSPAILELENNGGYEIRLYSNTILVDKI